VPVIPPRTAWLTSTLLRHVVTRGHAPAIRTAGIFAAGKTGTSSATMDTWFIGYTSRWMTSTWIGDDQHERPLGQKDAAFMLTVPMFARYMTQVTAGLPLIDVPAERPPGVKADDTGGKLRTTMEEVLADGEAEAAAQKKPVRKPAAGGTAMPAATPRSAGMKPTNPTTKKPTAGPPTAPKPTAAKPTAAKPTATTAKPGVSAAARP
jgi:membrane carboxypeptidase/penicillin-binding protein